MRPGSRRLSAGTVIRGNEIQDNLFDDISLIFKNKKRVREQFMGNYTVSTSYYQ